MTPIEYEQPEILTDPTFILIFNRPLGGEIEKEHKKKKKKDKKKKKKKEKHHKKEDSDEDLKSNPGIMAVVTSQLAASNAGQKQLHWQNEEDEFLCMGLAKYGLRNWDRICRLLPYRTFKAI